jgi:flagellin-specific chaperone FliS
VQVEVNPEMNTNILRLYEFVANELREPRVERIENARKVLRTLREGFEGVRAEANEMERTGKIPSLGQLQMVHATA